MKITCPTCETSYKLADGAIRAGGRKVRCTRCGTTWLARAESPTPLPPDEAVAEAEWTAVEAAPPPSPVPEPSEDEWRAALAGPERPAVTGGPLPMDDPPDRTEPAMFDPGLPEAPDENNAASEDLGEAPAPESTGGNVVPFERHDAGEQRKDSAAKPTIDAEPSGFARRAPRTKFAPRKKSVSASQFGAKVLSAMVLTIATMTVIGLVAGSLFAREAVVRRFPDLASLYELVGLEVNLRGLAFGDLTTFREIEGATPILVVEGTIHNVSDMARPVPRLRFGLRSTTGREVYAWTMEVATQTLEPGAVAPFRSRLPAPPEAATDVQVRFTDRRGP